MKKKVSIITPCYNGEKYLHRFLDSILNQTYKDIELIFVNDGSKDRTEKIIKAYEPLFEKQGIDLIYIYQDNSGQAEAINKGLKIFTGEYLTWPDSDDFLSIDSIEKKVKFLEKNQQYGLVRTDAYLLKESNLKEPIGFISKKSRNRFKEDLFNDYIVEKDAWFAPGCFMVRTSAFLDVNPERYIYPSRAGQNWQLLLPIIFKYKCGFIDEPLYSYVIRDNSHSHSVISLNDQIKRCYEHEDILLQSIEKIQMSERERSFYREIIKEKYIKKKIFIAIKFNDRQLFENEYLALKNIKKIDKWDRILYILAKFNIYNRFSKFKSLIKSKLITK